MMRVCDLLVDSGLAVVGLSEVNFQLEQVFSANIYQI